jgi:Domain of unknown function (DUF4259)
MGAWGAGPFENDDASDWVYELEEAPDLNFVRDVLSPTTQSFATCGKTLPTLAGRPAFRNSGSDSQHEAQSSRAGVISQLAPAREER